jgi:hypothetical protein
LLGKFYELFYNRFKKEAVPVWLIENVVAPTGVIYRPSNPAGRLSISVVLVSVVAVVVVAWVSELL